MTLQNLFSKTCFLLFLVGFIGGQNTKAQGANAPEAASFEPVDATDMVNLVTGNLSYVLPLLNVPSPEGGYPIALSYHAGIAMDQEASWVGLGWSINPGSINRSVNGYPDDWGNANISEFFYDRGWEEDYYSFSAGVTIVGAFSVGLGLSWGSNQSLGGYVSASIGIGENASIGGSVGTNGFGVNGSVGGFNASVSTSGVGIGYSTNTSSPNLGVSLNYSYSAGLSGGVSVSKSKLNKEGVVQRGKGSSLGINFSSNGMSVNGKLNGYGAGISTSSQTIDSGDYDVGVSSDGFSVTAGIFYIGWSHTKVTISLFKANSLYTSGMLYPVKANKLQYYDDPNGHLRSRILEENHFMDVNSLQPFNQESIYDNLIDDAKKNDRNNLMLPNYDNYVVNAQGLSGTISPYIHAELNLSGRGRGEQNNDNEYVSYLNHDISEYMSPSSSGNNNGADYNAITKKHFTFNNSYNSFLRLKRTNFSKTGVYSASSDYLMNTFVTGEDFVYNNPSLTNENRKREGNHITTYTNKEIRQGSLNSFIEAKEADDKLNRNDTDIFLDDGIGAYNITTLDGKTYHYSLPVYQFESFYKNFRNEDYNQQNNENENFFEILKTTPYATHWLLTAITGPDYYDKNANGKVDKFDYGYWVEFDYGKWSDGYIWQTPNGRYEESEDKDDASKKSYSYSWGRKQIYYLDAIKTRTHTAFFVKEIRNDSKSKLIIDYESKAAFNESTNQFNIHSGNNSKHIIASIHNSIGLSPSVWNMFDSYNQTVNLATGMYQAKRTRSFYNDIPENKALKLKKIILLNNKNYSTVLKSNPSENPEKKGVICDYRWGYIDLYNSIGQETNPNNIYFSPLNQKVFEIDIEENVLDVKDIEGLNLESQAVQVIDFEHDYSLADKAPNADTGRLTLNAVTFKGKSGTQVVPPYKFEYKDSNTDYNKDDIDAWGYHKTNPSLWSLNEITTPTGGKIKIVYGVDETISAISHSSILTFESAKVGEWSSNSFSITDRNNESGVSVGDKVYINYKRAFWDDAIKYIGPGTVTGIISGDKFSVVADGSLNYYDPIFGGNASNLNITYDMTGFVKSGGGITTESITVNDGIQDIATTEYVYTRGITSYVPSKEPKGIPYVSELPAPMVLYGEVEMKTKDGNGTHLGSTVYEFETLEPRKEEAGYIFSLGEAFRVKENQNDTFEGGKVIANKYTIESKLGNIGRIKSVKSFNTEEQLLSKTENHYKSNLDADGEIGVTQESHKSYKRLLKNNVETFYVSSTSKINYPSVLEKVTTTQGNFNVTQYFDKHDFLTGRLLETRTYASDGKAFKRKTVPAYTIPAYATMGSKIDDINNKNMLTLSAASYTYLLDETNNTESMISAGISTWNNDWSYRDHTGNEPLSNTEEPVWRKHKSFVWKGAINNEGIYTNFIGEDDNFNWGIGATQASTSNWQKASETTRYDHYSMSLEGKDINNNYSATKMGDGDSKVLAVSNAAYVDMYYSGAEYIAGTGYFDGEIKSAGYAPSTTAHTGDYVVAVSTGNAFEVAVPERSERDTPKKQRFKVSVWVRTAQKDNAQIKVGGATVNFTTNETQIAGNWSLLNGYITISPAGATVAITSTSGTIELDDFRLHPITSSMTSYVYNEWDEVSYVTGANGLSTHYIYDTAERLKETWVEVLDNPSGGVTGGFKRVSKNEYHYSNN